MKDKKMKDKNQIQVQVKDMPELHVAYVRHIGPYKGDNELFESLFEKLMKWAGPRDILRFPETQVLAIYHDNPEITDEDKLRLSVCVSVPKDTKVEGEIGKMTLAKGKYAKGRFEIDVDEFQAAWDTICGGWLPESGYQPDDGPCYELCLNDPKDHPEGKFIIEIYMPVKPL